MYKKALQLGFRFPYRGQCTTEDLFDLDIEELNEVYKSLKRQLGDAEDGLLEERTSEEEILTLKMAVVTDVFETKQAEINARKAQAERKARKDRILEIVADKQDEALMGKSVEELTAMIEEL